MQKIATPLALLAGAAVLAWLRLDGSSFNITPLIVGVTALAAVAVSRPPRSWTSGIVLSAWGLAVLLVRETAIPDREAPIYLIAVAVGALVAAQVARGKQQDEVLRGTALTMLGGGVLFYLAYDVVWITQWWPFALGLAVAGLLELMRRT